MLIFKVGTYPNVKSYNNSYNVNNNMIISFTLTPFFFYKTWEKCTTFTFLCVM